MGSRKFSYNRGEEQVPIDTTDRLTGVLFMKEDDMMSIQHGLPDNPNLSMDYSQSSLREIWLAGGCFWGTEAYLARVPGVAETTVGYANGRTENPTYEDVCNRNTGHAETVQVRFDPVRLSLQNLLEQFFQIIDPTSLNRQGNDRGSQYRTGIYYRDDADLSVIQATVRDEQTKHAKPIVTEVIPLMQFFVAEDYHQDYLEKNPHGYCHVSFASLPKSEKNAAASGAADWFRDFADSAQVDLAVGAEAIKGTSAPIPVKIDPAQYIKPDQDVLKASLTPERIPGHTERCHRASLYRSL